VPRIKFAILDLDGVILRTRSSWQLLHRRIGTENIACVHREAAWRGLIDYAEWALIDVFLWMGSPRGWARCSYLDLTPGAVRLLKLLYRYKVITVILSGGLDIACPLLKHYVDLYISNRLVFENGVVTSVRVHVNSKQTYADFLERLLRVDWSKTLAIGDSIIDVPVLKRAEYSIAFNPADEEITKVAKIVVYSNSLDPVVDIVSRLLQ